MGILIIDTARSDIPDKRIEMHGDGAGNECMDIYEFDEVGPPNKFITEVTFDEEELEVIEQFLEIMAAYL